MMQKRPPYGGLWYGGGERSPLYNRQRVNAGYAIFAITGYGRSHTVAGNSLAPPARLELTTLRLGGVRSIQVSYGGVSRTLYPK